jgi:hypothetical protein
MRSAILPTKCHACETDVVGHCSFSSAWLSPFERFGSHKKGMFEVHVPSDLDEGYLHELIDESPSTSQLIVSNEASVTLMTLGNNKSLHPGKTFVVA